MSIILGLGQSKGLQGTDDDTLPFRIHWNKIEYRDASLSVGELVSFCWCIQYPFIPMMRTLWWVPLH